MATVLYELERLDREATPGAWDIWRGIEYAGGGEDICIGAGETWLANMDHRRCAQEGEHIQAGCRPEPTTDICTIDTGSLTAEEVANATLIAKMRNALPSLLAAARALDWLAHLHHGASKGGAESSPPTNAEWKDALDSADSALAPLVKEVGR